MKTTIKLAVASALLAAASSASAAGGIVAGDWTLDIGGNVNTFYTSTSRTGDNKPAKGTDSSVNNITTGLLPNFLSVSGKTRQNDLDVGFTISMQPGSAVASSGTLGNNNNRQAFVTFGDKSWGSIKVGKDLGIFASDAILSDMTLLGVGQGAGAVGNTTLGRIGVGYMYADWKSQIAYTSPNFNGFSFTAGVTQAWNAQDGSTYAGGAADAIVSATNTARGGNQSAYEAKASYEWAGDVAGKVWVSALSQAVDFPSTVTGGDDRANAWDIGANVTVAGVTLTGYYGDGKGTGQTFLLLDGFDRLGKARDSEDWYVQATYVLPGVGTKLGASYGESNLDGNSADKNHATAANRWSEKSVEMWTVGAYHPITKHLNLVAEYSNVKNETKSTVATTDLDGKSKTISLGAILFF